jgi:tetratricopeptide (TPR) repeat protein
MYKHDENEIERINCINWRIFFLFTLLILIIYSNTLNASFHLDDFHNITQNTRIQINDLYPETIHDVMFSDSTKGRFFYRPISNLSIALNWYFCQKNVVGYHIVNICFHIITAFFLYLSILALFKTPNLAGRYTGDEYFIAILAAGMWAVNPIQTQAVTYIVQRMAAMSALFYIIGIFCYLKARLHDSTFKRIFWSLGIMVSFLLAVGSKENAIMFPISVLLVEMVFFQNMANPKIRKKMLFGGSLVLLIVFAAGVWLFLSSEFINLILSGYERRTFTFTERVLTQPRIVVFYLSQIFYPIADRLSIDHDVIVSTGLFSPWTTFTATLLIVVLIGIAIQQIKKRPLLAFAILFFFFNQIIESSVIALELIFEHRNYLPSLFLFLPIAAGIKRAIDYYLNDNQSKIMGGILIGFCSVLIMMFGLGTYVRNMAWINAKTLWEDTIAKAPGRARGYQNLVHSYYDKIYDYDQVLELSKKSMYLADSTRNKAELISLANMANVHANRKKFEKAIELYNRFLSIDPEKNDIRYRLILAMIRAGQMENVSKHLNELLSKKPDSVAYLNLKAFILLNQNKPETALHYVKQAVSIAPDDETTLLNIGTARMLMGEYTSAEHHLKRVPVPFNQSLTALLLLMENSVRSEDFEKAKMYADLLLSNFSTFKIMSALEESGQPNLQPPLSAELLTPVISKKLAAQSRKIQELANADGT